MTKLDSSGLYKNDGWDAQEYELPMGDVILVGVPAAFSPGCTNRHLPEFARNIEELSQYKIVFVSVDTSYVMKSWNEYYGHENIDSVGDPLGVFCDRLGEMSGQWEEILGKNCNRFAYLLKDREIVKRFDDPWCAGVMNELR